MALDALEGCSSLQSDDVSVSEPIDPTTEFSSMKYPHASPQERRHTKFVGPLYITDVLING